METNKKFECIRCHKLREELGYTDDRMVIHCDYDDDTEHDHSKCVQPTIYCSKCTEANKNGKHPLSIEKREREIMLECVNYTCQICNTKTKSLAIDHCHKTGEIRGVLCRNCNFALGLFKDNIEYL